MNANYNFIGKVANNLRRQGKKMNFSTLNMILKKAGLNGYKSNRGLASGVAAAYRRWWNIDPKTSQAIADTIVNRNGKPAWL